jgi:hypothetical protein
MMAIEALYLLFFVISLWGGLGTRGSFGGKYATRDKERRAVLVAVLLR